VDFGILGPLQVTSGGRPIDLGAAKQQALLAVLLLHANQAVSSTRLVDELWGPAPVASAAKAVQGYVSGLRKALGAETIETTAGGYLVRVEPDRLDAARFERLAAEGHACLAADPAQAGERLRKALGLWRGRPLEGIVHESLAASEAERLEELRLAVLEQRIEADLALGRHDALVGELQALAETHPYRERMRAHLMVALYRGGRQADALAAYRETRRLLADELGLEPSSELQRLERLVLTHDPELDAPEPAAAIAPVTPAVPVAPRAPRAASARRPVSVLVATVAQSPGLAERLDPESLHGLLDRCSRIWADALERHGGAVERHLRDGVVGVFGLAAAREDDPLRAVRAAVEMRDQAAQLGGELERDLGARLALSLGIDCGEVFVSTDPERGAVATGDAMVLADQLAQTADGGEILLGARAFALLEGSVCADPLGPLEVQGRAAAVRAWRLHGLSGDEPSLLRRHAPPFVGRDHQLAELREALEVAIAGPTCHLVTVVGAAGLGKSRLAHELAAQVGDRATVVVGHCLPYGDGLAYRPLAEIVEQLGGDDGAGIAGLVAGDDRAESIARLVSAAIGASDEPATVEETCWAVRRLLEAAARRRPLVAVVEDVHWAPPTLLDLLDYVVAFSSDSPILLLCLARPELLDSAPAWAARGPRRSVVPLEALSDEEAQALMAARMRAPRAGSSRGPRETPCSWSSSSPPGPRGRMRASRQASTPCWPRASTGWRPASARCSGTPRSRAGPSTSARCAPSSRRPSDRTSRPGS
jgi:DNA-binding SARP family transcriptional activator